MPKTKQPDIIEHRQDHNWIITPGLKPVVDEFLNKYKYRYAPDSENITKNKYPLIIHGDTGVGKSLFLKIFEYQIKRDYPKRSNNINSLNIASLHEGTIESELFGHEEGSFSGAIVQHIGYLEKANDGILIIEEVGEMQKHIQAKLLTFLDTRKFCRMGGTEEIYSNALIICTTNKYKEDDVFRDDFYERLDHFFVLPICARREDILYYFYQFHEKRLLTLTQKQILSILAYHWPGNVREIEKFDFSPRFFEITLAKRYLKKYDISEKDINCFLDALNFSFTKNTSAFPQDLKVNLEHHEKVFLKFFSQSKYFQDYFINLRYFCQTLWRDIFYNENLLIINAGSHSEPGSTLHSAYLYFQSKSLFYLPFNQSRNNLKGLEKDYFQFDTSNKGKICSKLLKKILNFLLADQNIQSTFDFYSSTKSNILKEIYSRRLALHSSVPKAAKSLDIPENTFRGALIREYPDLWIKYKKK